MQRSVLDYSVAINTVSTSEPLSVEEVKARLRINGTEEDIDLGKMITAARILVERDMRRVLISHTYDFKYDCFPDCDHITLPRSPLSSVTHLKYYDGDGTLQTWTSSNYEVDTARDTIWLAYAVTWPTTRSIQNAVQIRAVFAHAATDEEMLLAETAIHMLIGHWYENREAVGSVGSEVELAYSHIINSVARRSYP